MVPRVAASPACLRKPGQCATGRVVEKWIPAFAGMTFGGDAMLRIVLAHPTAAATGCGARAVGGAADASPVSTSPIAILECSTALRPSS